VLELQLLPLVHQLAAHRGRQLLELLLVDVVGQHLQQPLPLAAAAAAGAGLGVRRLLAGLLIVAIRLLLRLLLLLILVVLCTGPTRARTG
jgi:hypothetical protein